MSDIDTEPYRAWIWNYLRDNGEEVCNAMQEEFPELEIRKGNFHSIGWGIRQHYWCRVDEQIVDPTGHQHPDGRLFPPSNLQCIQYDDLTDMTEQEAIEAGKVPVCKCMNCGEPIYHPDDYRGVCTTDCLVEMNRATEEGTL